MARITPSSNVRSQGTQARLPAAPPVLLPASGPVATLASITAIGADGVIQVSIAGRSAVPAMVSSQVTGDQLHRAQAEAKPVLVVTLDGDHDRPVIIGVVSTGIPPTLRPAVAAVDGRRVELTGQEEVVLTCGKASITLTRAGKVIIKGTYVSAASTGVNRIAGGSVQIN